MNATQFDKSMMVDGNSTFVAEVEDDNKAAYQIASWYAMKINKDDGTIAYGRYEKLLLFEPLIKPPFDENKMPKTENYN